MKKLINKIKELTNDYDNLDMRLRHLTEEVGEYAGALTVDKNEKPGKVNKEPAYVEAVDILINAFALCFAEGLTKKNITKIGLQKIKKWKDRQKKK